MFNKGVSFNNFKAWNQNIGFSLWDNMSSVSHTFNKNNYCSQLFETDPHMWGLMSGAFDICYPVCNPFGDDL
jgi:hypothetical protein